MIIQLNLIVLGGKINKQRKPIKIPDRMGNLIEMGDLFIHHHHSYSQLDTTTTSQQQEYKKNNKKNTTVKYPLILLGGLGGSALMSQRDGATNEPHWWCEKRTDPFQIWISMEELIPMVTEACFLHDMMLELKSQPGSNGKKKRLVQQDESVKIYGKDIGGVSGVAAIVKELSSYSTYMEPLIKFLEGNGYEIGKSLRALTYDWRLGTVG